MRIALDATPLAAAAGAAPIGGLARYTAQLVTALAAEFPEDEFILVSDQRFEMPRVSPNLRAGARPRNIWERRWWSFGLQRELKRQRAEVFHGVDFAVPFPATLPAVMTIHDLSPWSKASWADDAWLNRAKRVRKRVPWLIRSAAARHIITPSEAVRREVIRFFRVDSRRVTAIPLAAAPHFRPRPSNPSRPFFLYAGMIERRKNVDAILSAWSSVHADVDLVLAGPHREEMHIPPQPGLHRLGVISEEELATLYSDAIALVYPSLYEGFGLPVLEAMQCGAPVIISSDPALVETAGDAGMQESSAGGLANAMQALLHNSNLRMEMRERSLARAALFSWSKTARATREIYGRILAA